MPPGYESSIGNNNPTQTVTCRLGPPTGAQGIANLRRTVPNVPQRKPAPQATPSHSQHHTNTPFNPHHVAPPHQPHYDQSVTHTVTSQHPYPSQVVQPSMYPQPSSTYPPSQSGLYAPTSHPTPSQQAPPTNTVPPYPTRDLYPVQPQVGFG